MVDTKNTKVGGRDRIAPSDPTVLMCDWHSNIRLQRYFFKISLESKGSDLAVVKKIKFIEMAFHAAGNFGLSVKTSGTKQRCDHSLLLKNLTIKIASLAKVTI